MVLGDAGKARGPGPGTGTGIAAGRGAAADGESDGPADPADPADPLLAGASDSKRKSGRDGGGVPSASAFGAESCDGDGAADGTCDTSATQAPIGMKDNSTLLEFTMQSTVDAVTLLQDIIGKDFNIIFFAFGITVCYSMLRFIQRYGTGRLFIKSRRESINELRNTENGTRTSHYGYTVQ